MPVVFDNPSAFSRQVFHQQQPYIENLDGGQVARGDVHQFLLDVNQSARDASALVREAWDKYNLTRNPDLRLLDLDKVVALIENDFPARLYYVRLRNSLFTLMSIRRARTTAKSSTAPTQCGHSMKR